MQRPDAPAARIYHEPVARDPFADDVLERLVRSNREYQHTHGYYIVPLSERLLAARRDFDALLADTLVLMDQTASAEVQMEARRRIIERHGKPVPRG